MSMAKWLLTASCAAALGVLHSWPLLLAADKPVVPDVSKYKVVERPTTHVVAGSAPVTATAGMADYSKTLRIEPAVKSLVASTAPHTLNTPSTSPPTAANQANPTVEPGKVRWHKTLADAQAAAQKSGKPVLLFHMMGQLDKQFC
jgi:hypothetical protein